MKYQEMSSRPKRSEVEGFASLPQTLAHDWSLSATHYRL